MDRQLYSGCLFTVNYRETDFVEPDRVAVLMAVRNGSRYLPAQLDSIARQTCAGVTLLVSDDGSQDGTCGIVSDFLLREPQLRGKLLRGPGRGYAQNFLSLVGQVGGEVPFAAFADQDDVWLPSKIQRALSWLETTPETMPAIYGARTIVAGQDLSPMGLSRAQGLPLSFRNALVQSFAGGNTIVVNRAALDLLQYSARRVDEVVSHDWWAYQVVTGAGGRAIFDPQPCLFYRQHGANLVGHNLSAAAGLRRLGRLMAGRAGEWMQINLAALDAAKEVLTPENRRLVASLRARRGAAGLLRAGLYRQRRAETLALIAAAAVGLMQDRPASR